MENHRQPADYQIVKHYECQSCGAETEMESCYGVLQCHCGGQFVEVGESYPADSRDWHGSS